jgi:hypothetical protein
VLLARSILCLFSVSWNSNFIFRASKPLAPYNYEHSKCNRKCWSLTHIVKGKGKVLPKTGHEGPEGEYRYSSTLSLTLALDGGGWSTPRPGHFTPGKQTRYPFYRRLGGPQGWSGRLRKISTPPGIQSPDRPARSESLYRLSYRGPQQYIMASLFLHFKHKIWAFDEIVT